MSELAGAWWSWIAPLSAQIAVIAVLFAIVDRCVSRRASVGLRSAFAWAFLVRLVLPPGFESPVALVRVLGETPAATAVAAQVPDFAPALVAVWLAGVVVAGALAVRGARRERTAWLADTHDADARITERALALARSIGSRVVPRVRLGANARGPAVVGVLRPVIVLPARLADAHGGSRLDHVLLHEIAHVARRDAWAACAWTCARVVFWFHPAVQWAARHAATLREIACDARAVRAVRDPAEYRATLLEHARELVAPRPRAVASFAPPSAQILGRLEALERAAHGRGGLGASIAFVVLCACVVPLARPRAAAEPTIAFEELEGCLRKRYAVMAALAAEQAP